MKIVISSDHHLGADNHVDNFGITQQKKFLDFLDNCLKQKIDVLVINGDFYELLQGSGWTQENRLRLIKTRYWQIENKLKELSDAGIIIHRIYGNHDYLTKEYDAIPEIIIRDRGRSILITHGHIFDFIYKNKILQFIGESATWLFGIFEQLVGKDKMAKVLSWLENFKIGSKKSARDLDNDEYIYQAIDYAKSKNVDIICIGHTHHPCIENRNGIMYVNSGCWINENTNFIYIDNTNIVIDSYG